MQRPCHLNFFIYYQQLGNRLGQQSTNLVKRSDTVGRLLGDECLTTSPVGTRGSEDLQNALNMRLG